MMNVLFLAAKELQEGLRNRWVLAATAVLAALALTLAFLGSAPVGTVGASPLDVVAVSLASLTIFLLPLIALLISYDAIVGEMERGTMLLLLSYPVARWQVLGGKFVGHVVVLAIATVIGYGAAALALAAAGSGIDIRNSIAFGQMIGSSVLLGAAFVAVGYVISALASQRGTAAGIAVAAWLLLVVLYDMILLGILVVDQGRVVSAGALNVLLLLNPADVYRMFNLAGAAEVRGLTGMAGLAESLTIGPAALLAALGAWVALPLALASLIFSRREV